MSTTRRFYLSNEGFEEEMALGEANGYCTVVDPDNLPPEAIERATRLAVDAVAQAEGHMPEEMVLRALWTSIPVAVRAFLSDPEPGDQT